MTASWTPYFYVTSVTGFDQSLLNGEIETSAVVVAGVVIVTLVTKYYLPRLSQN
ncbi:MAG: hypothetical protein OK456_05735 [Thaumarchaeota archaeon]|nr:hypothetical protein [Nitrososphaerota archaeon]